MAKHTKQTRGKHLISNQASGVSFEQNESIDDGLLPEAEELAKLQALDPNIIEWIKARTEKEQDGRLDFNSRKMTLLEGGTRKAFQIDIYTITCALIVILAGMAVSVYLIEKGLTITGSIFAGATIVFAANAFLNFRKNKNTKQGQNNIPTK